MKHFYIVLALILFSCQENQREQNKIIEHRDTILHNGNIYTVIGYYTLDSIATGTWVNFVNGDTSAIDHYKNGKLHGQSTGYYPNGEVSNIGYYVRGEPDSIEKRYDYEGNLVLEIHYVKGKVNQDKTTQNKNWQPDGSSTTIYVGDSAGYYQWENGKKHFVRALTDKEIEEWKTMNKD